MRTPTLLFSLVVLFLLGSALSVYSVLHYTEIAYGLLQEPSFCSISESFNCDAVARSSWALLFGFPLGSYGLAFYLGLILFSLLALDSTLVSARRAGNVLVLFTLLGLLYSIFLLVISHYALKTFCLICIGLDIVNLLALIFAYLLNREENFINRLFDAVKGLIEIPALVFGAGRFKGKASSAAGLSLVFATLIAIAFSLGLSDTILGVKLKDALEASGESPATPQTTESEEEVYKTWLESPQDNITFTQGSPLTTDYSKGPVGAPIELVEFLDVQCPLCRVMFHATEELLKTYGDKVHYVVRNYPLDNSCNPSVPKDFPHFNACFAAHISRCAGEQGKFWEVIGFLFQFDEIEEKTDPEEVRTLAKKNIQEFGLDMSAIDECMKSERQLTKIRSDIAEADRLEILGTPSIWINKRKVAVASPQNIKLIIDTILKQGAAK